ncbi:MAG: NAD(+) synthase [Eubacteriales bacterium]
MKDGLFNVCAACPPLRVADVSHNLNALVSAAREAVRAGASVLVFPELSLCGYTCGDLLYQTLLLTRCEEALAAYLEQTAPLPLLSFVGLPVRYGGKLYNCAAAVCGGKLLGLVPKVNLANHAEFQEMRWFEPAQDENICLQYAGQSTCLGHRQLFCCQTAPALRVAAEICEDLWVPVPPSATHAAAGATLVVNLCASTEFAGKAAYRRDLVRLQSEKNACAYLLANAGEGESTTDAVFSGHHLVAEAGRMVAEKYPFTEGDRLCATVDLALVQGRRPRTGTRATTPYREVGFSLPLTETKLLCPPPAAPFLAEQTDGFETIFNIQAAGLATRMRHTRAASLVIGVSGGLDSTVALLACVRAADRVGMARGQVIAVSMPGFGTTPRTRDNAGRLAALLGVSLRTVDIRAAVTGHFADIGHDPARHDTVYENAQARERTQILMDIANAEHGLVVGTGDLSELALGWATYNGDHMSMYAVNGSIPKTLLRDALGKYAAQLAKEGQPELAAVLTDVLATPVSPELLPPAGEHPAQQTEALLGPYALHDYFLYHLLYGAQPPRKILRLASASFAGVYEPAFIRATLKSFLSRFFAQQYKRSCMPDGPKATSLSLSPRGDWQMPSDASAAEWLKELD